MLTKQNYLTNEEFEQLLVGTHVWVIWSGGNGPIRYTVEVNSYGVNYLTRDGTIEYVDRLGEPTSDGRNLFTSMWLV